ncbi:MAG: TonB-dependent receptor [Acidobacteriota bacterium]
MSRKRCAMVPVIGTALLLLWSASRLQAQTDRGTITGTVSDSTGAVIAGARVVAANTATGLEFPTITSQAGVYTIPQLTVGLYRVSIEQAGFKKFVQDGIRVELGRTVRVDASLQVGEVSEVVEVSEQAQLLNPDTSELGTTISNQQILDLPLSLTGEQRSPATFIRLVPGVVGRGSSSVSNPQADFSTTVNGGQTLSMEIQLEGASILGSNLPGDLRILGFPVDAVQEFKMYTNNFAAELGRTGGGVTSFTLKSGTNDIHGSVYEYFRNEVLNARGFFQLNRQLNKQNEYGFTIGGPIIKDRTFAFGYFNGFRYRAGAASATISVPTDAFKNGDFSSLRDSSGNLIQIYDPATTKPDGQGGFTRDPFPGNIIPSSRISSVAKKLQAFLPQPNRPGNFLNYTQTAGTGTSTDQWGFKVDHSLSSSNKINVSLAHSYYEDKGFTPFAGPLATNTVTTDPIWVVRLSDDWFIRPNIINHGTVAFNRNTFSFIPGDALFGCPTQVGLTGVNQSSVCPQLNISSFGSYGGGGVSIIPENGWNFVDNVTWISGKHSYKFGFDFRANGDNTFSTNRDAGFFDFSYLETSLPGNANTGAGYASFLLGAADAGEAWVYGTGSVGNRSRYYALFFQDDYKVSPKLTLNMGLRYDIQKPRYEVANRFATFDPTLANPGAGGRPGAVRFASDSQRTFADTDWRQFGPRFGLAYSLDSRTVFRGGYGIYYSAGGASLANGHLLGFTMGYQSNNRIVSTDGGITPAFFLDQGFPQNRFPRPPFIDPSVVNGGVPYYMAREDGHGPYIQNWNVNIQRELPGGILVDAAYVGSKGTRLISNLLPTNQLPSEALRFGNLLYANVNSPEAQAAGIPLPYAGFNGSVAQALKPFPQYSSITRPYENSGNSTYNAFQLKVTKRFSQGLAFLLSYTASKILTDSESQLAVPFSSQAQDKFNRKAEKSISQNDYPHNLVLSYSYELPFGPGKRFLNQGGPAGKLLGGWAINGIQQYQSGAPLAVTVNNPLPGIGGNWLRPNLVPGARKRSGVAAGDFDPEKDVYINAAAFSVPAPFTLGNAPRWYGDLRKFAYLNEDFSIIKRTSVTERVNIEFRADFINAFNRVVFGSDTGGNQFAATANANLSDPATFGRVSSQTNLPRTIQFGLKVNY